MNKELKCIGVGSQKQMGKDTLADYLVTKLFYKCPVPAHGGGVYEDMPWGRGSFAGPVKRIYRETFNKTQEFVEEWKVKKECPPGMTMSVRESLTFIGDGFRKIQPDIWIEMAFRAENQPDYKIFSDVRYLNEAKRVKSHDGLTILIHRENNLNWDENKSEAEIRPYLMWCIENGKEGHIASWKEFQDQDLNFRSRVDFANFYYSLPEQMRSNGNEYLKKTFFENLSCYDLFIRAGDGVENVYHKADKFVLPYIKANYSLNKVV